MQRQLIVVVALVLLALAAGGCVSSAGRMNKGFGSETVLETGNHKVVSSVQASHECAYVIGIPLGETDLWSNAMNRLRDDAKLSGSQAFSNMAHDETTWGFGNFYYIKKLTISADVVEFTK